MEDFKGKDVKIPAERFYELLKAESELLALEGAGVDNWCGYGEHVEYRTAEEDILSEVRENIIRIW